ncbi:hypothetical protein Dsin_027037 [Dipteronia sinensis]|uniref:Uncharacterized protein n=1 Tax=Dipteronia sinensis TaxID=43782 RepID=A0AAD9ZYV9_9ROSI|nr:hypothetical protein Dsin_027037 [Dipteronia sinensis]
MNLYSLMGQASTLPRFPDSIRRNQPEADLCGHVKGFGHIIGLVLMFSATSVSGCDVPWYVSGSKEMEGGGVVKDRSFCHGRISSRIIFSRESDRQTEHRKNC